MDRLGNGDVPGFASWSSLMWPVALASISPVMLVAWLVFFL